MKKSLLSLCVLIFLCGFSSNVFSASYTMEDVVTFNKTGITGDSDSVLLGYSGNSVNKLEFMADYVLYEHNFTFIPTATSIESAFLTIDIRDDKDCRFFCEIAFLLTEDGTLAWGEVDTASYNIDIKGNTLLDGSYKILIASLGGDFFVDKSTLTMNYTNSTTSPVPEPATMFLFGCGLLGLAGYKRKTKI